MELAAPGGVVAAVVPAGDVVVVNADGIGVEDEREAVDVEPPTIGETVVDSSGLQPDKPRDKASVTKVKTFVALFSIIIN